MNKISKNNFSYLYNLYSIQPWLLDKEDILYDLITNCSTEYEKYLITDLLSVFVYLNDVDMNIYLNDLSLYIINDSSYSEDTTIIAAITIDDTADSSQKILDLIKFHFFNNGWVNVKYVNRFNKIPKYLMSGYKNVVLVDEFIGSGKTILNRIKSTNGWPTNDFTLTFCFIAGMKYTINELVSKDYKIYCPLQLKRGISDRYEKSEITSATNTMLVLETILAKKINHFDLDDYSLGYNRTEALYSLKEGIGNTPNSVFPIFWWPRYSNNDPRKTLLTRVERGLK